MKQRIGEDVPPTRQRSPRIGPLDFVSGICAIALCCLVFWDSTMRYVLGVDYAGTPEIAMILLACISFLGAATAYRDKQHLAVTFIVEKTLGKHANIPRVIVRLINLAFFATLTIFGIKLFLFARMTTFTFLPISKAVLYLVFVVGIVAMIYYECVDIFNTYMRR
jgi:TRAP-type C4-dicarboxylate transport system permease small subunit